MLVTLDNKGEDFTVYSSLEELLNRIPVYMPANLTDEERNIDEKPSEYRKIMASELVNEPSLAEWQVKSIHMAMKAILDLNYSILGSEISNWSNFPRVSLNKPVVEENLKTYIESLPSKLPEDSILLINAFTISEFPKKRFSMGIKCSVRSKSDKYIETTLQRIQRHYYITNILKEL